MTKLLQLNAQLEPEPPEPPAPQAAQDADF
jgi:hypothetical protein